MKRQYYVHFYRPFANTYNLYYADTPEMIAKLPNGALRTSKKDALKFIQEEFDRKKFEPTMSGFAASTICPSDYPDDKDIRSDPNYVLKEHVWERR